MSLNDAAERLGVHYQTAYRWVREGRLAAAKIGTSYEVTDEELSRFSRERDAPHRPPETLHVRDWSTQAARFYDLLVRGDEPGARRLVRRLHEGGVSAAAICQLLMAPALRRVGEEWAKGDVTVAEEHRASAICEWTLGPLVAPGRGRPRGVCVVATPPGEQHSLPGVMATAVLREARWRVHHLGANVPVDALRQMVDGVGAELVVFSPALAESVGTAVDVARQVGGGGVRTLVGEPGASLATLLERAASSTS